MPLSNREMFCSFASAIGYMEEIPSKAKTPVLLLFGKQVLGIEKEEGLKMLVDMEKNLEYMIKTMMDQMAGKKELGV